jgi:Protein of unknown function (DUF1118)
LSKLERSGLLETLENSGITLAFIEKNKLLSKAEDFGAIRLLTDRCGLHVSTKPTWVVMHHRHTMSIGNVRSAHALPIPKCKRIHTRL